MVVKLNCVWNDCEIELCLKWSWKLKLNCRVENNFGQPDPILTRFPTLTSNLFDRVRLGLDLLPFVVLPATVHCPKTETLKLQIPNWLIFISGNATTGRFSADPSRPRRKWRQRRRQRSRRRENRGVCGVLWNCNQHPQSFKPAQQKQKWNNSASADRRVDSAHPTSSSTAHRHGIFLH